MNTYKVSELIVIRLRAGKDSNGNSRNVLVLTHALDGFLDAVSEGPEGEAAVSYFAGHTGAVFPDQVRRELRARITTAIDTSPSTFRHFATQRMVSTVPYTITL